MEKSKEKRKEGKNSTTTCRPKLSQHNPPFCFLRRLLFALGKWASCCTTVQSSLSFSFSLTQTHTHTRMHTHKHAVVNTFLKSVLHFHLTIQPWSFRQQYVVQHCCTTYDLLFVFTQPNSSRVLFHNRSTSTDPSSLRKSHKRLKTVMNLKYVVSLFLLHFSAQYPPWRFSAKRIWLKKRVGLYSFFFIMKYATWYMSEDYAS